MKTILVFPGQGSQSVGMGKDLAEAFPVAREVFAEIDDVLNQHLSKLMFEGPLDELTLTANAQPALMATSMAVVRILELEGNLPTARLAAYVAGHSLGEYAALTAVGAFSLAEAARLLKLRGGSMQAAVPQGQGAMAALLGGDFEKAQALTQAAAGNEVCCIANDNSAEQQVISGHKAAVDRAIEMAPEAGFKRAILLPVSAPFHSPLMMPAAEAMMTALSQVEFKPLKVPVIANMTAQPIREASLFQSLLGEQVTGMVRWRETMETMQNLELERLIEVGSGKILSGMAKRALPNMVTLALNTPADINDFMQTI